MTKYIKKSLILILGVSLYVSSPLTLLSAEDKGGSLIIDPRACTGLLEDLHRDLNEIAMAAGFLEMTGDLKGLKDLEELFLIHKAHKDSVAEACQIYDEHRLSATAARNIMRNYVQIFKKSIAAVEERLQGGL